MSVLEKNTAESNGHFFLIFQPRIEAHKPKATTMSQLLRPKLPKNSARPNLPKDVKDPLKTWFIQHRHHPYPTDQERQQLAQEVGKTETQVFDWIANTRKRVLRPLLEGKRLPKNDFERNLIPADGNQDAPLAPAQQQYNNFEDTFIPEDYFDLDSDFHIGHSATEEEIAPAAAAPTTEITPNLNVEDIDFMLNVLGEFDVETLDDALWSFDDDVATISPCSPLDNSRKRTRFDSVNKLFEM